jgi:hypothetical protein
METKTLGQKTTERLFNKFVKSKVPKMSAIKKPNKLLTDKVVRATRSQMRGK